MMLPGTSGSYWRLSPMEGPTPAEFVPADDSYLGGYGRWYLTKYEPNSVSVPTSTSVTNNS